MASARKLTVSDKLKSLGLNVGTSQLAQPKIESRYEIDSVVAGAFYPTRRGDIFIAHQSYSSDYTSRTSHTPPTIFMVHHLSFPLLLFL